MKTFINKYACKILNDFPLNLFFYKIYLLLKLIIPEKLKHRGNWDVLASDASAGASSARHHDALSYSLD